MLSAFYICCIYSSTLQSRFYHGSLRVQIVCNIDYLRKKQMGEQMTNVSTRALSMVRCVRVKKFVCLCMCLLSNVSGGCFVISEILISSDFEHAT